MQSRLSTIRTTTADAYKAMLSLEAALGRGGVPHVTLDLIRLRVSQINGCSFCVDMHSAELKKAGQSDRRLWSLAAWRESTLYTAEERAALNLAEYATRIADTPDAVPDAVWNEAAAHYGEDDLAYLVMTIAAINAWNRINVTIRNTGTHGAH
ncbi:carboxymuconolactone decarboxylase family protein [Actinomadura harenae]|uniref:Carboxymuconolactone decarboxylase family protein n=1 Tax=Actinomadura harenae TaxID=2483351 RepID=A0A3M2LSX9_9ACTN|nr:carboxymuconolactone decarboxylase family protein [Actinomadura harenae]RMI39683.1 carboxymuconolactone decarboxylase family protein [Actinomadura harenae]